MSSNPALHRFLDSIGLSLDDQYNCINTNSSLESTPLENIIVPLTHYDILAIEGPDSAKFLQGQTTCDITKVDDTQSLNGAYCSAKGRLLSSFQVARSNPERYLLRMHRSIVSSSKDRLSKYIVFSKAEQHILSDDSLAIGLYGPQARSNIEQTFGQSPQGKFQCLQSDHGPIIQLDEDGLMFECWLTIDSLASLWPQLNQQLKTADSRHWQLLNIQQGIAEISSESVDLFIPQMLNYQITGAINFTKGCYTGQEVVARMHYKGKTKRRLYRIAFEHPDTQTPPAVATPLYGEGEQSIGDLVNIAKTGPNQCEALAVITIKNVEENCAYVGSKHYPVQILPLPYAIT